MWNCTSGRSGEFMLNAVFFVICFGASAVGIISGTGGGVIIKPVLDALDILDIGIINFLSGCTVFSMTAYSVISGKMKGESNVNKKIGFPLAIGAAFGGLIGRWLFSCLSQRCMEKDRLGAIQSLLLFLITLGILVYTVHKEKIKTYRIEHPGISSLIGMSLGMLSSFLGIGGGPVNLMILCFFFSMSSKEAAENSLYIIFFSQAASLISYMATGNIPDFSSGLLILMVIGALSGGIFGRNLNDIIKDKTVDGIFIGLLVVILLINAHNVVKFM
ncbi:sulfite exporter TauE/SafE family protein [Lachnospiraceae bacterium 54-53]